MQLLLDTADEWATRGKPLVLKELAAACQLEQTRPSKWMRIPEFREELALVIRRAQPALVEGAITAVLQLAVKGNLRAFETVMDRLERLGRLPSVNRESATPGNGVGPNGQLLNGVIVNVGIPLPAGDRSSLPPPVMRGPKGEPVPMPQALPTLSAPPQTKQQA